MSTTMTAPQGIDIEASDVSRQKHAKALGVPPDSTIGDVVRSLIARMRLPRNDQDGAAIHYQPLLEREGRHLQSSELVGDVLKRIEERGRMTRERRAKVLDQR